MHGHGPFRTLLNAGLLTAALLPLAAIALSVDAAGAATTTDTGIGTAAAAGSTGDAAQGSATGAAGDAGKQTSDAATETGFPADTPVAEMTAPQQAAYWKHQSRRHERRATENAAAAEERDRLKAQHQTESEKALEAAKAAGRTEAMQEVVEARLSAALTGRMTDDQADALIDGVNHIKFLGTDGKVDTTKVREWVDKVAPKNDGAGAAGGRQKVDTGGGNRGGATGKSGREAGLTEAERRGYRKPAATT